APASAAPASAAPAAATEAVVARDGPKVGGADGPKVGGADGSQAAVDGAQAAAGGSQADVGGFAERSDAAPKEQVQRLLRLRVPVRVQLAARKLSVAAVRRLSLGAILEFSRCVDDPLTLLVNNQPLGEGEAVKVGEH